MIDNASTAPRRQTRVAAVAVLAVVLAATAQALSTAPARAAARSSVTAAASDPSTEEGALALARSTGVPQAVTSMTTPTTQVLAEPAGTFVANTTVLPTRTQHGGAWVPVDLTLNRNGDGTYAPNATAYDTVAFSGGGSIPLATISGNGGTISFSWPTVLPAPSASADTLTYAEVMPGVDLQVHPSVVGGFSDVLVVKNAQAATDPGLRDIQLHVAAPGASVTENDGGGLTAVSRTGQLLFESPPAQMWDSASTPSTAAITSSPAAKAAAATSAGGLVPDPPTSTSPGLFAHQAAMPVSYDDGVESVMPDLKLLTAASTTFPVYIDPSYANATAATAAATLHPASASGPAFDEVKQGSPCNGVSYYDDAGSDADYGQLGVGYNGFAGSGCLGNDAAYYQFTMPAGPKGGTVTTATMNATEVYSATSAATAYPVYITATGGIGRGTDWNNKPAPISSELTTSRNVGPATSTSHPAVGFDTTEATDINATFSGSQLTFELFEPTNTSDVELKRFADNPTLSITYDHVPATPSAAQMSMTSGSTKDVCATESPLPYMGKTASTSPPVLRAVVSDPDKDAVTASFTYWNTAKSTSKYTLTSANTASGGTAAVTMPASFITGLGATATVAYSVTVYDLNLRTGNSVNCQVKFDTSAPANPTVTSTAYPDADSGTGLPAGSSGSFTFASSTDTSVFIYQLTTAPATASPATGTSVAASNGTATVSIRPHTYGLNRLFVYAKDAAGNVAGPEIYQFLADHDAPTTWPSLSAAYNSAFISSDSAMSAANLGKGYSFSAADLASVGYTSGRQITVDGASMALPTFGSGQHDNVLAANQTISINDPQNAATGQYANGLVMLAFGVYPNVTTDPTPAADTAVPYLPGATRMSAECPDTTTDDCGNTGSLKYTDGTQNDYNLEVPDWTSHGVGEDAYSGTKFNTSSGTSSTIYAPTLHVVTIPLDPNRAVTSITLPDLSAAVDSIGTPTLHIVSMGLRNTATSNAPSGQTWTSSWAEPMIHYNTSGFSNTLREALRTNLGGTTVRLRLDNSINIQQLTLSHVTVAPVGGTSYTAGAPSATPVTATFGGAQSVSIPEGAEALSDPVTVPVSAGGWVYVSLAISGTSQNVDTHPTGGDSYVLASPSGSGDHTMDTTGASFSPAGSLGNSYIVSRIDVATGSQVPTVASLGDQLVNTTASGATAPTGTGVADLADDLATTPGAPLAGYVDAGIANNLFTTSQAPNANGGPSLFARIDRDVLDQPNIGSAVLTQGMEDILQPSSTASGVVADYTDLLQQLQAFGINVIVASATPCAGNTACTAAVDTGSAGILEEVDNNLAGDANYASPSPGLPSVVYADLYDELGNGAAPAALQSAYTPGDRLNLSSTAYTDEAAYAVTQAADFGTIGPNAFDR